MTYVSPLHRGVGSRGLVAVAAIAALAACAFAQAPTAGGGVAASAPAPDAKPKITVDNMIHDFGVIYAGPPVAHSFKITNTGTADLHITKVNAGCSCTAPGEYPHVLKPGESGQFPFTVNTSVFPSGLFTRTPSISSDDPTTPDLRLTFKGTIKHHIDVLPRNVVFAALGGKEPQTRAVRITNNTETPLKLTMQTPPPQGAFQYKCELAETKPGKEFELKVTAGSPWGDPGTKQANITLQTNLEQEKVINIPVSGTVPARIEVWPVIVRVMRTPQGRNMIYPPPPPMSQPANSPPPNTVKFVNLINRGDTPIKITEVTTDDPAITATYEPSLDGKKHQIRLEMPGDFLPPQTGRKLTIKTDDPEKPVITIPIMADLVMVPPTSAQQQAAQRPPTPLRPPVQQPPQQQQLYPTETLIGKDIPVFKLTSESGKTISNTDLGGPVAVLDFFSPKCGFCRRQMPVVDQVRKEYEAKGVRFLYVSQPFGGPPTKADCTKMMDEIKVTGDLAMDPEGKVGDALFKAASFPTMVILDKKGKVSAVNVGAKPDLADRMKKQIDALLAGKPVPEDVLPSKNALPPPAPQAPMAQQMQPAETLVGKDIPVFKLTSESGKTISNTNLGGPVAVLDFFSPKCPWCRRQMPVVDQIRKEYEGKGVRFLYVSQPFGTPPTKEDCTKMMDEIKVTGDLAMDPEKVGGQLFKALSFPTMVILDKSGKVAAVNIGGKPDLADRTKKALDALLAGKPIPQDLLPPKNALPPAAPQAPQAQQMQPAETLVGKDIPAFKLTSETGKPIAHNDLGGPVAVLDFFSPRCPWCRRQMPVVDQIRKEYEAKGVRFLYVSQKFGTPPTKEDCTKMMQEIGVKGDLAMDPESKIGNDLFKAASFPTMVILDKGGKVAAVNIGGKPDLADRMKKQIDALLAGKPIPQDLLPPKPAETAQQ